MWQLVINRLNFRFTVAGMLSVALVMSLVCSMSVQYGHADTPVAATAFAQNGMTTFLFRCSVVTINSSGTG